MLKKKQLLHRQKNVGKIFILNMPKPVDVFHITRIDAINAPYVKKTINMTGRTILGFAIKKFSDKSDFYLGVT